MIILDGSDTLSGHRGFIPKRIVEGLAHWHYVFSNFLNKALLGFI